MAKTLKDYLDDVGPDAKEAKPAYVLSADDVQNLLNGGTCEHEGATVKADPKALKELQPAIHAFMDVAGNDEEESDGSEEAETDY